MTMTSTKPHDTQDESESQNLPDREGPDLSEDNIVKLLAQIVRKQNDEINKILVSQNEQAKKQSQEQRRLSGMIEHLNSRLTSFLESREQCACDKDVDLGLVPSLKARIDAIENSLRDQERFKDEVLQPRVDRLEAKVDLVETKVSKAALQSTGTNAEEVPKNQVQGLRLSHRSSHSMTSLPTSPFDRARVRSVKAPNTPHRHTTSHSQDITSDRSKDSISSIESFHHQATSLIYKTIEQDASLSSHKKDLLNLKRRLAHAERLIGAQYRIGSFSIHGLSFYQDAAALRYISSDAEARDAFKMFYGSRLAAADYVDIAPSAILACFDIISRVRCRHDLWTDDKLEVKQRIRCVAEQIVDDWIQSLPLREGGEHVHVSARELQSRFNQLRLLCNGAGIVFDFMWPEV